MLASVPQPLFLLSAAEWAKTLLDGFGGTFLAAGLAFLGVWWTIKKQSDTLKEEIERQANEARTFRAAEAMAEVQRASAVMAAVIDGPSRGDDFAISALDALNVAVVLTAPHSGSIGENVMAIMRPLQSDLVKARTKIIGHAPGRTFFRTDPTWRADAKRPTALLGTLAGQWLVHFKLDPAWTVEDVERHIQAAMAERRASGTQRADLGGEVGSPALDGGGGPSEASVDS